MTLSPRKQAFLDAAEASAGTRARWRERAGYFHADDIRYLRFLIPEGKRVLDLGCGIGDELAALKPSHGVGVDFSGAMIAEAKRRHPEPELAFVAGDVEDPAVAASLDGPFDYIILVDTVGFLDDCQATLELYRPLCHDGTRIVVCYYNPIWALPLGGAERAGLKMPQAPINFLRPADIANILSLAGFEAVKTDWRQLVPAGLVGIGTLLNRFVGTLPLIRRLSLRHYVIGRPSGAATDPPVSCTVIVPVRNERGNVEAAVTRTPRFCDDMEIIFVEGHSRDGTYEEAERVVAAYPQYDIKLMRQDGVGKADAVFKAFDAARGDVLMILDGDLTVPPEQLPKFWHAIRTRQGEYVQGSRLVYPLEKDSMRFLNMLANHAFSLLFTWLLNQRYTDTLCGTKVIRREDYIQLKANRSYFGDFDPFGDFDLIFGAAKMNLKTVEIPIRYAARTYGETQISRFRHGLLLVRMVIFAYRKLKAF